MGKYTALLEETELDQQETSKYRSLLLEEQQPPPPPSIEEETSLMNWTALTFFCTKSWLTAMRS